MTIKVTVLYFASAQSATGLTSEEVELPFEEKGFPLSKLGGVLCARHPETGLDKVLETSQWSINAEMVMAEAYLTGGEELAVICPVSAG
jgi:molybdopterin converting factor small subunit